MNKATQKASSKKPRQLGRVDSEVWDRLKLAASRAGENFTEWAVAVLTAEVDRMERKKKC